MVEGCLAPKRPSQHPFGYCSTVGDSAPLEAVAAVKDRPGAVAALNTLTRHEKIVSRDPAAWSSSDLRLLAIHGLIRKVGTRTDLASFYSITPKGREVLGWLAHG